MPLTNKTFKSGRENADGLGSSYIVQQSVPESTLAIKEEVANALAIGQHKCYVSRSV